MTDTHEPPIEQPVEFTIEPVSERFGADDERWSDQVSEFLATLREEGATIRKERETEPGKKGGAESIILALGTAGVFTAAVEYMRVWIGRDKGRKMKISYTKGDVEESWVFDGSTDAATFEALSKLGLEKLGSA